MGLQRRTPLPRGGALRRVPLAPGGTLGRGQAPARTTPIRQVSARRAGQPQRRPVQVADPIPAATRALVHTRSGDRCELCGTALRAGWRSIQHRQRRGTGGSARDARHDVANLLDVCGPNSSAGCHGRADEGPDRFDRGWQVRRHEDPVVIPVVLAGARRVLLTPTGGYVEAPVDDP